MLFLRYRVLTVSLVVVLWYKQNNPTECNRGNAILNLFIDKVPSRVNEKGYDSGNWGYCNIQG